MCKQESLIRMLNPVITGWGNYYRYGASTDAFMVATTTFIISRRNGPYVVTLRNASLGSQTGIGMKFGTQMDVCVEI
ncbi:group II intron maturase-specific domain-containing protein [Phocaeicola vulgatus]|uniref:group II intron maturase-specific domain-containing protein n=1 Tax=Phocaeicola vulgatus TaxID=821 RepID=UPI003B987913